MDLKENVGVDLYFDVKELIIIIFNEINKNTFFKKLS